jgi:ankyrin repeat protein
MSKERFEGNPYVKNFTQLQSLILQRQEFETKHPVPPYSLYKTDFNFTNLQGNSLLHFAATIGDMAKINYCLKNNTDINLKNAQNQSAITIALKYGHLDVAEYLFQQGADCNDLNLTSCLGDEKRIAWLSEKIRNALHESFPNPGETFFEPIVENQFFKKTGSFYSPHYALNRAAEIGDIEFIRARLNSNLLNQKEIDSFLIIAARNGQLKTVEYLCQNNANINSKENYVDTALIEAVKVRQQDVINFLLGQKIDVNQKDCLKSTALSYAVMNSDKETINKLITLGASINHVNVSGNTLLHLAILNDCKLIKELLTIPGFKELVKVKNIYGYTPLDLAIQNKQDELIQLLAPESDLNLIKKDAQYGIQPSEISQAVVNHNMFYRLRIKYRDTSYFSVKGNCNGFAYLKPFYARQGKEQYYFDTLALMANWDGSEAALQKEFNKDIPQAQYYKNLDELFEHWTNDLIWFQHSELEQVDTLQQDDRVRQYSMIKGKEQGEDLDYIPLYKEPTITFDENNNLIHYSRTKAQLVEIFSYLTRMPANVQFQLGGGQHQTSSYNNKEGELVYYDPNFRYKTENTKDFKEIIQRIIDFKYIYLNKFNDKADCNLQVHCYQKDLPQINFSVLDEKELPKSQQDAFLFQQNSANQFTPLHIAIMTRSIPTLQRLLKDGFCDVNAKDCLGRSVFKMALDSGFSEAVKLLLAEPGINLGTVDKLTCKAYSTEQKDIVQTILVSPDVKNLNELLLQAIKKEDLALVKTLLSQNKANINQITSQKMPLIKAIESKNQPMIQYLLECGADLFMTNGVKNIWTESPLRTAFSTNSCCVDFIIPYLKDINQQDTAGRAAIHHAAFFANADALQKLINYGANIKLRSSTGETVFYYLNESRVFDMDKRRNCLKLLIENYDFSLADAKDHEILQQLLIKTASEGDDELYQLVISNCNKEMLNSTLINDIPLLNYFMYNNQFDRISSLLEKGAEVDPPFPTGNTPLMGLIQVKNIPQKYDLIPLFIQHGSDLTIKNKEGKTAIDLVNESDDEQIKEIFYEHGLIEKESTGMRIGR